MKPIHAPPPQWEALLARQLHEGESLLWVAQPDARRMRRGGYWIMPFGAAILAFVVLGLPQVSSRDWQLVTVLMLGFSLLALLGLGLLAAPYLMHASAKATLYAITTERALILTDGKRGTLRAYRLRDLGERHTRARADGSGDLILEREEIKDADGDTVIREHGFLALVNVHEAARVVDSLQRGEAPDAVLQRAALWTKFGHLL